MKISSVAKPLAAILFGLVLMEGVLQLAALANSRVALLLSPGMPSRLSDERLGRRANPAIPEHDDAGFRNPVALERAEIVVLGDSQTYGSEVSRANAWPLLLGAELGMTSYNMGFGGWSPVQHYLLTDQALALEPRVLIVGLYSGNDFAEAYKSVLSRGPVELREGAKHNAAFFDRVEEERGSVGKNWRASQNARRGWFRTTFDDELEFLDQHCKIYGLYRGLSRIGGESGSGLREDSIRDDFDKYARKIEGLPEDYYFPFRFGEIGTIFRPAARRAVLDESDPRIEEGIRITLAVLESIQARCRDDCSLIVVWIPTKEFVFRELVAKSDVEPPQSFSELLINEERVRTRVEVALQRQGTLWIDTTDALRQSLREGRNPYLSDWNGHPNVEGNLAIARRVAADPHVASR